MAGDSPAKWVQHNCAEPLKHKISYQVSHQISHQVSYQGHRFSDAESLRKQTPLQGLAHRRNIDRLRSHFGMRVPSKMRHHALNWGCVEATSAAGLGEVPSSYRYYFGNLGFFWRIFRDINPIAARQALGWEFRGFLALV